MKKQQWIRGSVSIFLVIVLVPMLTFGGMIVDLSRVRLARAVVESAGDLTLNTAMTNYDVMLKDIYGLFAAAQDQTEALENIQDYFVACMTTSGVDAKTAQSYGAEIFAQLGLVPEEGSTDDLLNIKVSECSGEVMSNGTLANPLLTKYQVVNFMKYRTPINTGLSFLSAVKGLGSLAEQNKLVEKRKEYYEEQGSVMQTLCDAYGQLEAYMQSPLIATKGYLTALQTDVAGYEEKYQTIHSRIVKDLYDNQGKDYILQMSTDFTMMENGTNICIPPGDVTDDWDVSVAVSAYSKALEAWTDSDFTTWAAENAQRKPDQYDLQIWTQAMRKGELTKYTELAKNYYSAYWTALDAVSSWEPPPSPPAPDGAAETDTEVEPDPLEISMGGISYTPESWEQVVSTDYSQIMGQFKPTADYFYELCQGNKAKVDPTEINAQIADISTKIQKYCTELTDAKSKIDTAKTKLDAAIESVEKGKLKEREQDWNQATQGEKVKDTTLATQDKSEIENVSKHLNIDEMGKLSARLGNISVDLEALLSQLDAYTYCGKKLKEIPDYASAANALKMMAGHNPLISIEPTNAALNAFVATPVRFVSGKAAVDWMTKSQHQPDLKEDTLKFYSYLVAQFGNAAVKKDPAVETAYENYKGGEKGDKKEQGAAEEKAQKEIEKVQGGNPLSGKDNQIAGKENLPSGTALDKTTATLNADIETKASENDALGALSGLWDALMNVASGARDNLYTADYVMSMFSYDTIENEYRDKNNKAEPEGKLATITGQPINGENNYAYGREVEYILYGKTNTTNVVLAYSSIYGIRLASNLIYGFATGSVRQTAFTIAAPISAATMGVIPVPLIQAVVIIGMAMCESALDLVDLSEGDAVPLYKNKNSWKVGLNGIKAAAKEVAGVAANKALQFAKDKTQAGSTYLQELLDKGNDELANLQGEELKKLEASIGNTYETVISTQIDAAVETLTTLASDAINKAKAEAGFDAAAQAKFICDGLDAWLNSQTDARDSVSYYVKEAAVNILKTEGVNTLLGAIRQLGNSPSEKIMDLGEQLKDKLDIVRKKITDKLMLLDEKVTEGRKKLTDKAKEAVSKGADQLTQVLDEEFGKVLGSTGNLAKTGEADNALSALLSFRYSDYLRLFLVVGMMPKGAEGAIPGGDVLRRITDVIQCNLQQQEGYGDFCLANAPVYVQITAKVQVKPLLMAIPLLAPTSFNPEENQSWYTIEYQGIRGY